MNQWLKWVLLLFTIGGGFAGLVVFSTAWNQTGGNPFTIVILIYLHLFFAFGILSGILLVEHVGNGLKFCAAYFLLQVPFVQTPLIVYDFMSGFGFRVFIDVGGDVGAFFRLGAQAQLFLLKKTASWGAGLNIVALVVLMLIVREIIRLEKLRIRRADELSSVLQFEEKPE